MNSFICNPVLRSFDKFVPAFRAGDLDLSFSFRYTDHHTALLTAEKFMCFPLIPALLQLSEKPLHFICQLQEPQSFF